MKILLHFQRTAIILVQIMRKIFATLGADLFFVWVLLHFGLGGLAGTRQLLALAGPLGWVVLGGVLFLLLFRSNYRSDLPLFAAGVLLGYWGEWWGTTRGVYGRTGTAPCPRPIYRHCGASAC